jgi:outer membrane murein-binding lipoprotein Lpp
MNPLLSLFLIMSVITIQPSIVKPGDEVKLSIQGDGAYIVEILDEKIYFKDSFSNIMNVTPGEYTIKVGYTVKPGTKTINIRYPNGTFYHTKSIIVYGFSEADLNYLIEKADKMDKEIRSLNMQIMELQLQIEAKEKEIETLKTEGVDTEYIKSLEDQITNLKAELVSKTQEVSDLNSQISELNDKISQLEGQLAQLQAEKKEYDRVRSLGSPEFLEFTRFGFFFMVAFTVGIVISLLRR